MSIAQQITVQIVRYFGKRRGTSELYCKLSLPFAVVFALTISLGNVPAHAQNATQPTAVPVLTGHNDNMRTGQNTGETLLNATNVNATTFGKLFSQPVNGLVFGQPLFVPKVTITNSSTNPAVNGTTHNVVYVGTSADYVYAFDADSNGGTDGAPLWKINLLTNVAPVGLYSVNYGVDSTPVIDASTSPSDPFAMTMFLVSSEITSGNPIFRLHAIDITTGAEKFNGPFLIQGSVAGTGSGSTNGTLAFNAYYHHERAGLLMLNGVVYVPFASSSDNGPWHGWIMSYGATTNPTTKQAGLVQLGAFCTTPNGFGGGIWMGGAGLAAEVVPSTGKARMFVATGNGTYQTSPPANAASPAYSNPANQYSMSVLDLSLNNGYMTVEDVFTPYNEAPLDGQDGDLGSGGPIILPTQTLASGKILDPVIQAGKSGMIYIMNRDNVNDGSSNSTQYTPAGMGGFNPTSDKVVQEVQTPLEGQQGWGAGVWGSEAYWNNNIYYGGTASGYSSSLAAYSFKNGVLSSAPTSFSSEQYAYPGPTPSVSSNGTTNGIVWVLDNSGYFLGGNAVLAAYDATNLGNLLYSSNTDVTRDTPGAAVEMAVPTVTNGKAYVGGKQLSIYGLLASTQQAPPPVIAPSVTLFSGTHPIVLTDTAAGATFYYTTDGTTPTVNSTVYTGPFIIDSNTTISAIASVTGMLLSNPTTVSFTSTSDTVNPVLQQPAGTYLGSTSLTITDASPTAAIYYTVDGTTPTTASTRYTGAIPVTVTETIKAIAIAPGLKSSGVVGATYTITPNYAINFPNGFSGAQSSGQVIFNGSTDLDDYRLQLTNGGLYEAGSAFYAKPVNVQSFTTDFTFQISNPVADGMTFTIQNVGPNALGGNGGGLGFVTIQKSVAIKFDLFNNSGEGSDSTGLYYWGNVPKNIGSIDMSNTPIGLHSGDQIKAHVTYDGTNLTMTLTNSISLQSWSYSWPVNIPQKVGGNTAWVGFTGGTGGYSSSQKVTYWTYLPGAPVMPNYPTGFDNGLIYSVGSWINGTSLQLTSGGPNEINTAFFFNPVNINTFTSDFDFRIAKGATAIPGNGFTFTIQNKGLSAIGGGGSGLGYSGIPNSVAIKFDSSTPVGAGTSSTGLYVNGAMPTTPAISLAVNNISLLKGDLMHAHITYDGTTLYWSIQDMDSIALEIFFSSVPINLPNVIGSNTAYVGFTAASGTVVSTQDILDWTFSNNP